MKIIIIFLTIIILHSGLDTKPCYAQTKRQWSKYQFGALDDSTHLKVIRKVVLISEKIAYGIGEKKFRTNDGGASWETVEYPKSFHSYSEGIDFYDSQIIYLTGKTVYISNDTGATWSSSDYLSSSDSIPLLYDADIRLLKKNHAVIGGSIAADTGVSKGGMIKTTDGGETWAVASIPDSTPSIFDISFVSDKIGIACTYSGHILRTTDAGNTWKKVYQNNARDWLSCKFGSTGIGVVGGTNSALLMTIDSGATWKIIPYILDENGFHLGIYDAYPFDSLHIIVGDHRLRSTTDGGASWSVEDEVFPIDYPWGLVVDIDFVRGYGMAAAGPIVLYSAPLSNTIENSVNDNVSIIVSPNPVTSTAIIRFSEPSAIKSAQLRIYNVLGEQVWNSIISASQIQNGVSIPCGSLPAGKYIIEVIAQSQRVSTTIDIFH